MNEFRKFIAITKVDAARRELYGVVTSEAPDKDGEICDYATTAPLYHAWSAEFATATEGRSLGNVREMHTQSAVGKITALDCNDEAKSISVRAQVVDDDAWKKCEAGVYTGFSHGGKYLKTWPDGEYRRYTAEPSEISLVDNPCNPEAHFEYVKADGTREVRKFVVPSTQYSVGAEEQSPVAGRQSPAGGRQLPVAGRQPAAGGDGIDNMDEVDAAMGRSTEGTKSMESLAGTELAEAGPASATAGGAAGATSEALGKLAGENRDLREQLARTEAALIEVNARLKEMTDQHVPRGARQDKGDGFPTSPAGAKGDRNVLKACLARPLSNWEIEDPI